jgi:hypothetical protein
MVTSRRLVLALLTLSCAPAIVVACSGDSSTNDGGTDATTNDVTSADVTSDHANDVTTQDAAKDAAPEAASPPPCMIADDAGATDASADAFQVFGGSMYGCRGAVTYPNRATLCRTGCTPCTAADWMAKSQNIAPTHQYWTDDLLQYAGGGPPNDCFAAGPSDSGVTSTCSVLTAPMRVCMDGPLDAGDSDAVAMYPYSSVDIDNNVCNWTGCAYLPSDAGVVPDASQNLHFGGCDDDLTAGTLCCCP